MSSTCAKSISQDDRRGQQFILNDVVSSSHFAVAVEAEKTSITGLMGLVFSWSDACNSSIDVAVCGCNLLS